MIIGSLVLNLIITPIAIWAAYKSGEAAEEMYRRRVQVVLAAANAEEDKRRRHS